jgi:5-deoxy-5-amino-3-dehydroquinate synthase
VAGYDLPMDLPSGSSSEALVRLMLRDKKATDGLTFVLDGPRGVEVVKGVAERTAAEVLRSMGAS